MADIQRRRVLFGIVATASLGVLPASAQAQANDVIKIGILTDMNGPLSQMNGPGTVVAAQMAIKDFNARHPEIKVALEAADIQNKPDVTVAIAREWLDNKGVDLLTDVPISAGALAVGPLVADRDKLAIFTSAASTKLTGENCGPNHVQWTHDTYSMARAVVNAQMAAGGKSWFFITADTAFGQDLEAEATRFVKAQGGKVLGSIRHPYPGNTDFSSYLLQAQASGADVIALANSGPDAVNSVKQAQEFGILAGGQKLAGLFMDITAVQAIGLKLADGVVLTEAFYWNANDSSRKFAERFKAAHGAMPSPTQAGQYSAITNYLNTVAKIGVEEAKRSGKAVLNAMRSEPMDDALFGTISVRADGRAVHPMLVLQVKGPDKSTSPDDIYDVMTVIPGPEAFRPLAEGGCPLVKG